MKIVNDLNLLNQYLDLYHIKDIFSHDISEFCYLFTFKKNEHICKVNEELAYLYFFVDGKAKVYNLLKNGRSLLLRFYKPLKVIGDIEFLETNIVNTSIQVIEDAYCIGIPLNIIREKYLDDNKFLRYMCKSLGHKLDTLSKSSSINILYPLESRLAYHLLHVSDNINLTETSELLGVSYRHLLRTIDKLVKENIIKKDGNVICIINKSILQEIAEDLYE